MRFDTIPAMLVYYAARTPDQVALESPPMTYAQLHHRVTTLTARLRAEGVHSGDRIAVAMGNSPEIVVSFLAATCVGTCAPLNPNYTQSAFEFFLRDLEARVLIVGDSISPYSLPKSGGAARSAGVVPETAALVLHTSGSTAKPKLITLTQENLCASADNVATSLELSATDRCLNVMPLFHIHGLVGAVLSTLTSGGSVICTAGFEQETFFGLIGTLRPTWYTAVPTIHEAISREAAQRGLETESTGLRFIRSCSAPLSRPLMARLESQFGVPVVEAYGMTEAAHQISINPLPPRRRKPGSVGLPTGPEVMICDDGEIAIRGTNVTRDYRRDGWFHTGDLGYFDADGYLFITGRIKDIINRGGEKISPREIDDVFLDHPKVAQAVTLGVPHPTLGQDVAVAIVPKPGVTVDEEELRTYAFEKLAAAKVPSRIICIAEIPKGPTGKLRRIDLHSRLHHVLAGSYVEPATDEERKLVDLWKKVLQQEKVGVLDNFFLLGGDSLSAVQLAAEIARTLGVDVPPAAIFRSPTVSAFARMIPAHDRPLVRLSSSAERPRLFCIPGTMGNVFTDLGALAKHLQPAEVFAFQDAPGNPVAITSLAGRYVAEMIEAEPHGPYFLIGVCSGAIIAFEMAQQLRRKGKTVAFLAMVEPIRIPRGRLRGFFEMARLILHRIATQGSRHSGAMLKLDTAARRSYLRIRWRYYAIHWSVRRYRPALYGGNIHLYLTQESIQDTRRRKWSKFAKDAEVHTIEGTHGSITGKHGVAVDDADMQSLAASIGHSIRYLAGNSP